MTEEEIAEFKSDNLYHPLSRCQVMQCEGSLDSPMPPGEPLSPLGVRASCEAWYRLPSHHYFTLRESRGQHNYIRE
jgi:hypothetical protein